MPHRACLEPTCREWATYRGRCKKHSRQNDQSIDRKGRKVYGLKRWRLLRRRKLFLNPLCEMCGALAKDVHHKHGVEADPWSIKGLESLCKACHGRITRQSQAA